MLIIVFGVAGSGKTYVAKLIAKHFGFHHEDADQWLPQSMQSAIHAKQQFTKEMLAEFTDIIISNIQKQTHENLVVSQGLYREENRQAILKAFPKAKFLQVNASPATIHTRLAHRKDWVDYEYALSMYKRFEPMPRAYVLENDAKGEAAILKQLRRFFLK